ncbi:MAG: hypothetical protein RLZZ557_1910, partial [Bacteroidota bacterium]
MSTLHCTILEDAAAIGEASG